MGLGVSDEFSFLFLPPVRVSRGDSLYRILGFKKNGDYDFSPDDNFDGKYVSSRGGFEVRTAQVGGVYIFLSCGKGNFYYVLLDKNGKLSEPMDEEEIKDHFTFVEAST